VKREGRLTKAQEKALEDHWPTKGIDYADAPLSLPDIFGRSAPVVVEIGFGMGKSLVEMAANAPEKDFIGIEVHRPGVGACLAEASEQGVENLRVMDHDAVEVLKNMIPDGSLAYSCFSQTLGTKSVTTNAVLFSLNLLSWFAPN